MAVELLVRKYDGPANRKSGDIVSVKELPHSGWGEGEGSPDYVIIRIKDKSLEEFKPYYKRHIEIEPGKFIRSKYRFPIDEIKDQQVNFSEISDKLIDEEEARLNP